MFHIDGRTKADSLTIPPLLSILRRAFSLWAASVESSADEFYHSVGASRLRRPVTHFLVFDYPTLLLTSQR